ncbi:hypothetical protein C1645_815395 [Glomus cerebriforme]|uniref:Uncharacterized protein n=1 Tax=Glomus cerebriforme TaxID=658196 RepID=A0A397TE08_9GLOM|nr:hypothetical protein C1645_815395 [Glomus cerebriforme]
MVAQNSILAAADHDFTKLSITPLVIFFISIPNEISESFYDGQNMLNNRTERLSLKKKKFKCNDSANMEAITELFELSGNIVAFIL